MIPFAWENVGNDFVIINFYFEKICEKHVYQRLIFLLATNLPKSSRWKMKDIGKKTPSEGF